jgi:hypothetical protein
MSHIKYPDEIRRGDEFRVSSTIFPLLLIILESCSSTKRQKSPSDEEQAGESDEEK